MTDCSAGRAKALRWFWKGLQLRTESVGRFGQSLAGSNQTERQWLSNSNS